MSLQIPNFGKFGNHGEANSSGRTKAISTSTNKKPSNKTHHNTKSKSSDIAAYGTVFNDGMFTDVNSGLRLTELFTIIRYTTNKNVSTINSLSKHIHMKGINVILKTYNLLLTPHSAVMI